MESPLPQLLITNPMVPTFLPSTAKDQVALPELEEKQQGKGQKQTRHQQAPKRQRHQQQQKQQEEILRHEQKEQAQPFGLTQAEQLEHHELYGWKK